MRCVELELPQIYGIVRNWSTYNYWEYFCYLNTLQLFLKNKKKRIHFTFWPNHIKHKFVCVLSVLIFSIICISQISDKVSCFLRVSLIMSWRYPCFIQKFKQWTGHLNQRTTPEIGDRHFSVYKTKILKSLYPTLYRFSPT